MTNEQTSNFNLQTQAEHVFASLGIPNQEAVDRVASIKAAAAKLWLEFASINIPPGNNQAGRLVSLAKTDLESSVMWAVKAISRG